MTEQFNYDEALREVQDIISQLESADCTIDSLSSKIERAVNLLKQCKATLTTTDHKIKQLLDSLND